MLCRSGRAWLLVICLLSMIAPSSFAQGTTRVTIRELLKRPDAYYDQQVELECYYDKESPIWVSVLPQADEWVGFFVTGPPDKALTWTGEYYNLLFAPRDMQEALRTLRGGDKITIVGEGFHYHSKSLDSVGVHVEQVLRGWGTSAKPLAGVSSAQPVVTETAPRPAQVSTPQASANQQVPATSDVTPAAPSARSATTAAQDQATVQGEKYVVLINGRRYTGLRFGDRYNFDGVDFQIERQESVDKR